ncbi:12982_t:CDS:2 [Entrophospora sp. SA101]|nr:12982_t:CDS:2 [Entrophospora sp. SA101]
MELIYYSIKPEWFGKSVPPKNRSKRRCNNNNIIKKAGYHNSKYRFCTINNYIGPVPGHIKSTPFSVTLICGNCIMFARKSVTVDVRFFSAFAVEIKPKKR